MEQKVHEILITAGWYNNILPATVTHRHRIAHLRCAGKQYTMILPGFNPYGVWRTTV